MPDIFIDKDPEKEKTEKSTPERETQEPQDENNPVSQTSSEKMSKKELLHNLGIKEHGGTIHAFSSYFENPSRVHFSNSINEEIMLLFLRRHFLTNTPWILKALAMALVPVIFEFLSAFGLYSTDFISPSGKFLIYFFFYFFIFSGYILVHYMTWFYNVALVTNFRVIDIDFSDIIYEDVAATKISQLEDVNYKQIGIVRSLFDYGDVFVQTAGTNRNFEFLAVPHPENVIRIINSLLGKKQHA
jgi:hypothetical protein